MSFRCPLSLVALLAIVACSEPAAPAAPPEVPGEVVGASTPVTSAPPGQPGLSMTSGALGTTDDGRFEMDIDVRLMDASGPIVGEAVTFAVTKGKGTLTATRALTDAEGYARTVIRFGLADENVIESWTATEARAVTTVMAYCAAAPEQTTLPCPAGD